MDDWQEAALSNRHMHNRRGQNIRGKAGKGAAFDVHRTFGMYELKCPAADKLVKDSGTSARLEIYCLNDSQNALYAEVSFPGLLHGMAVLAGSRRVMNKVLQELAKPDTITEERAGDEAAISEEEADDEKADEDHRELANQRAQEFEKNSFKSPKFWMKWQGQVLHKPDPDVSSGKELLTDSGYLVFSGNTCDKFEGTISCEPLGWDNVKLKGWKGSTRSARNFDPVWRDV